MPERGRAACWGDGTFGQTDYAGGWTDLMDAGFHATCHSETDSGIGGDGSVVCDGLHWDVLRAGSDSFSRENWMISVGRRVVCFIDSDRLVECVHAPSAEESSGATRG